MAETTDLTKLGEITGTLERPKALDPNDRRGTENITSDELRLPRLGIAQGLSHEMTPGDSLYIQGLTHFDMFNTLNQEIYGKGPITFVPLRRDTRRIEFKPREEGGGVVDMDVPPNDPRLDWTTDDEGNRIPPQATLFTEFISVLLRPGKPPEPIVISIKHTNKENRRAAENLTTFIKLRNAPIFAGLYTIDTSIPAKNDKGTYGVPTIKNKGFIPLDTPAGKALYDYVEKLAMSLEGKEVIVDREPGADDEATDFPPVPAGSGKTEM